MKNKFKVLGIAIATLMAISAMAGCTTKPADKGNSKENVSENTSKTPVESEKTSTVIWYTFGDKQASFDAVMEDINTKLLKKANIQLDLRTIAMGEYQDKLRIISTSGEAYDLAFTSNWLNSFADNMAREGFLEMDDLLKEHGQGILERIPKFALDAGVVNGKTYAISLQGAPNACNGLIAQQGLLDKYKFDINTVKKAEDLEPFLENIKNNEPTLIPIYYNGDFVVYNEYESFANELVYLKRGDTSLKLVGMVGNDAIHRREKLKNDWYKKGYIQKDIATATDQTDNSKNNRFAITTANYFPDLAKRASAGQGIPYTAISLGESYIPAGGGLSAMTAISVTSSDSVAAMKMLNIALSDDEIYNELVLGIEGANYTKDTDNLVTLIPESGYNLSTSSWGLGWNLFLYGQSKEELDERNLTVKMVEESIQSPAIGFSFDTAPVQAEVAQLISVVAEYKSILPIAKDIDAAIKEFEEKMEKAGSSKVVSEAQKQIDAWAVANGKK